MKGLRGDIRSAVYSEITDDELVGEKAGAAILSIILLAVLFLNLLEKTETLLFKGNQRGYVSD